MEEKIKRINPDYRDRPLIFRCPACAWKSQPWWLKSLPTPHICPRCEAICKGEEMKDELD